MHKLLKGLSCALVLACMLFASQGVAGARTLDYDCLAGTGSFGGLGNGVTFVASITTSGGLTYLYTFTYTQPSGPWTASASSPAGGPTIVTTSTTNASLSFTVSPAAPLVINDATANSGNFAKQGTNCPPGYPLNLPGAPAAGAQPFSKPLAARGDAAEVASGVLGTPSASSSNDTTPAVAGAVLLLAGAAGAFTVRRRRARAN